MLRRLTRSLHLCSAPTATVRMTIISDEADDRYVIKGSLGTASGAKTMALDAETHRIFVPALGANGFEILIAEPE
jgi:hypothetical protein